MKAPEVGRRAHTWAQPGSGMNKWGELSQSVLGPSYISPAAGREVVVCFHRRHHVMTMIRLMADAVLEESITILFHILRN